MRTLEVPALQPEGVVRGADQGRTGVQRDLYLDGPHQIGEAPLVGEGANEGPILEAGQDLRRDASSDIHATD